MVRERIQLMAHLMRRAEFGASDEELEQRATKGFEAAMEVIPVRLTRITSSCCD